MKHINYTINEQLPYEEPRVAVLLVAVEQGFYASNDPQIDPAEGEDDFGEF